MFVPSPNWASFIGKAAAQAQEKSREALYLKCRHAVFKKYGHTAIAHSGGLPGYLTLTNQFAISATDRCVANGGRLD